jgi:replicative DNA helicase
LAITLSITEWLKAEDITTESESIRTYANMLLDMAQTRRLMGAADEMNAAALNLPPDKAQEYGLTLLQDLSMRKNRQESGDVLDALRKADSKKPMGFTTGMEAYDNWSRGFWAGAYHTIGGYRGTGKTGFMLGRMYDAAASGARCCYFSNETPVHLLVDRLRGYISNTDWRLISMAKDAGSPRWSAKQDATEKLMQLRDFGRIYLFDRQRSIASIRMMVLLKKPDVIFVDYIQHLTATGGYKQKEYDRISECSLALQEMANQEGICVVAGSQISVAQAKEGYEGEPEMKGSGSIVADSTFSAMLIRDKKTEGTIPMARVKLTFRVVKSQVSEDNVQVELMYDPATARLTRPSGEPVTANEKGTWWTK